jgi:hypothetical protein
MVFFRLLGFTLMISSAYSMLTSESRSLHSIGSGVSKWAKSLVSTPSKDKKRSVRRKILDSFEDETPADARSGEPNDIEVKPFLTLQDAVNRFNDQVRARGLDSTHLNDPRNLEDLCWERASLVYSCQEAGTRYEEQATRVRDQSLQMKISSRILDVLRRACSLGLASSCGLLHGKGDEIDAVIAAINLQELCSRGARESCEALHAIVVSNPVKPARMPSSLSNPTVKEL